MSTNVKQAVPFFWVVDMNASLKFYVEGLGFTIERRWVPDGDGKIRWCRLEIGDASVPLRRTPLKDGGAGLEYHRLENSGRVAITLYVGQSVTFPVR